MTVAQVKMKRQKQFTINQFEESKELTLKKDRYEIKKGVHLLELKNKKKKPMVQILEDVEMEDLIEMES